MMEKTEMMKRYEEETGRKSVRGITDGIHAVWFDIWHYQYLAWLEAKATAYDRLMSGGKKKPKEVANFLDLPIAQDKEGFWHAFGSTPVVSDGLRGEWNSFLGYKQQIPSCNIRYSGNWKDSLTLPDEWEEK